MPRDGIGDELAARRELLFYPNRRAFIEDFKRILGDFAGLFDRLEKAARLVGAA